LPPRYRLYQEFLGGSIGRSQSRRRSVSQLPVVQTSLRLLVCPLPAGPVSLAFSTYLLWQAGGRICLQIVSSFGRPHASDTTDRDRWQNLSANCQCCRGVGSRPSSPQPPSTSSPGFPRFPVFEPFVSCFLLFSGFRAVFLVRLASAGVLFSSLVFRYFPPSERFSLSSGVVRCRVVEPFSRGLWVWARSTGHSRLLVMTTHGCATCCSRVATGTNGRSIEISRVTSPTARTGPSSAATTSCLPRCRVSSRRLCPSRSRPGGACR